MLIPELAVNPLGTRIIEAFFTEEYVSMYNVHVQLYVQHILKL